MDGTLHLESTVPFVPFTFESQARQYPRTGLAGIEYFRGETQIEDGYVDCLLYRARTGTLIGILNHYPQDLPPFEQAGNFLVLVHPRRLRRGIGSALLANAHLRWHLDWTNQKYTPDGLALVTHYLGGLAE